MCTDCLVGRQRPRTHRRWIFLIELRQCLAAERLLLANVRRVLQLQQEERRSCHCPGVRCEKKENNEIKIKFCSLCPWELSCSAKLWGTFSLILPVIQLFSSSTRSLSLSPQQEFTKSSHCLVVSVERLQKRWDMRRREGGWWLYQETNGKFLFVSVLGFLSKVFSPFNKYQRVPGSNTLHLNTLHLLLSAPCFSGLHMLQEFVDNDNFEAFFFFLLALPACAPLAIASLSHTLHEFSQKLQTLLFCRCLNYTW